MRAPTFVALGLGLLLSTWQPRSVQADAPSDTVVAKVGSRAITAGELERRMAGVPPFQLRSYGKNADEVRRNFLEKVLVREALLALGAEDAKLAERADVQDRLRNVLRNAMIAKMRSEVVAAGGASDEEVKQYYDANAAKYHSPPRVAIWRITVATREEAQKILDEMKKDPTPKRWNEIARERSLDKATNQRGGNLGFVGPDGATAEPGVKVDPAIVSAASAVKDAEIVQEPLKDGDRWSVIWRRQSMRAVDRTLEQEAPSIKQVLTHEKTEKKITQTLEGLRKERVSDFTPERVDEIEVLSNGDVAPAPKPGAKKATTASPKPTQAPGGQLR